MTDKTKKIIAREGLIIAGIIVIGSFFILTSGAGFYSSKPFNLNPFDAPYDISNCGKGIILFGYPIYLIVRFIIWAVRTLRER